MELNVYIKNNYGRETVYPVCEAAHALARIARTTTLTRDTIREAKQLGFTFRVSRRDSLADQLEA